MLSRNILNWLVLLTLAAVTRSEHYHIVPVDSTDDLCHDYRNGTCFTLKQLIQTDLLSGGDNLTLSLLPGDHVLTEQLLICNFSHVHLTSLNKSKAAVRFHSNSEIRFVNTTGLNIERLGFVRANVGLQKFAQSLLVDGAHDVYIKDCYFKETHAIKIANIQTATIVSTLFMNNIGRALHVEADDVYITNSEFTRNDRKAVYIQSNNALINNTEFHYNSAWSGGAVEVISGAVVITWCNFTNNIASRYGGAIHVGSGSSVNISNCKLTNNSADIGGAIYVHLDSSASISDSILTDNSAEYGGMIHVDSGSNMSIFDSTLTNNYANYGGAIRAYSGTMSISNSTLSSNRAGYGGGAISLDSDTFSVVSISNSKLTNNRADFGGAISAFNSGSVIISNCELTNNSAADGHDGGGAIDVNADTVSISNSKLTSNSADYGGAIHVGPGGIVYISNCELTKNSADYGGAIRVYSGTMSISNSTLSSNRADYGGGAISLDSDTFSVVSISNSKLTNNRADFGGAISAFNSGSVIISNCELTNNSAADGHDGGGAIDVNADTVSISNSKLTSNSADYGGAIHVGSGGIVYISNCELTKNSADYGGAIRVYSGTVSISDSIVTNNIANEGGAIDLVQSKSTLIHNTNITNNMASFNILQSYVRFTGMNIVSNNNGPVYAFASQVEFNGPTTLSKNHGVFGGAIRAVQSQIYINTEGFIITNNTATFGGGIFLRESTLFVTEPTNICYNTAHKDGGGIYAFSSRVEFQPSNGIYQSEIVGNIADNGGGIHAVATSIKLTQSYVNIDSNTATSKGGGIYLQQSSKLYLLKKDFPHDAQIYVKLMINNNSASYGGGIFVADDTQSGACRGGATEDDVTQTVFADCFIQTIKLYDKNSSNPNYFNTFMTGNTANHSGVDIYGGLLDRCTADKNAEYHIFSNGSEFIKNTIKFSTEPPSISSRPVQVIFCNYSQRDSISTRRGHTFKISVMAVDQVGSPMNSTIHSSIVSKSGRDRFKEGQAEQEVGNQCTELEYNVFSQDSSAQVELYAKGPCFNWEFRDNLLIFHFNLAYALYWAQANSVRY